MAQAKAISIVQAPAPRPSSVWTAQRGLTIGLLLTVTMVAFEALAVATVLPFARDDLGGTRFYGWAFSSFLLASLVGIVWAGAQSDTAGPARPLALGLALFSIGLVIAGTATTMPTLVVGRAVQGLGAGAVPAVAYVCIGRAYHEDDRAVMLALFSTAWIVPALVGPAVAAAVAETLTWRLVFIGLLPVVAIAGTLTLPVVRALGAPTVPTPPSPGRLWRAGLLAGSAALFLGGITTPDLFVAVPLAMAGVAGAGYALRQLFPRGTLRAVRGLPSVILGHGLLQAAFFGTDAFVPLTLITLRGESAFLVGAGLSAGAMLWTAGTWLVERKPTVDRRRFMALGLLLVGVEAAGMIMLVNDSVPVVAALVAWGIGAFGIGLAFPSFSLSALSGAPAGQEGVTSSSLKLAEALGAALGAGVGGALVAAGDAAGSQETGVALTFALMAAIAVAGALVALRTRPMEARDRPAGADRVGALSGRGFVPLAVFSKRSAYQDGRRFPGRLHPIVKVAIDRCPHDHRALGSDQARPLEERIIELGDFAQVDLAIGHRVQPVPVGRGVPLRIGFAHLSSPFSLRFIRVTSGCGSVKITTTTGPRRSPIAVHRSSR